MKHIAIPIFAGLALSTLILSSCDPGTPVTDTGNLVTCEGCHTNEAALKNLTSARQSGGDGYLGQGGQIANTMAPWEKVFIKLTGNQSSFRDVDPVHGVVGCINCHGGKEPAEYADAHDTILGFIEDPSAMAETNCTPCHDEIVASNSNSMHSQGWGQKTAIVQRQLGSLKNHQNFAECPSELTDGFDDNCTSCHTSCGQCHLSRPNVVGGGLVNSHQFSGGLDQDENCLACHSSRIGTEFRGEIAGHEPDAHFSDGKTCLSCHNENFHADASNVESRYHVPDLPSCKDCHQQQEDPQNLNAYHSIHWPGTGSGRELACQVCHSQPYKNCNSCHVGSWQDGSEGYSEYTEFRIGRNYNESLHLGKWTVVRHVPVTRETYSSWGQSDLATYDDRPTWEYASPHNILKHTPQTSLENGPPGCYQNCHLTEGISANTQHLFLWQSFVDSLFPEESAANASVTVDDDLPANWIKY